MSKAALPQPEMVISNGSVFRLGVGDGDGVERPALVLVGDECHCSSSSLWVLWDNWDEWDIGDYPIRPGCLRSPVNPITPIPSSS